MTVKTRARSSARRHRSSSTTSGRFEFLQRARFGSSSRPPPAHSGDRLLSDLRKRQWPSVAPLKRNESSGVRRLEIACAARGAAPKIAPSRPWAGDTCASTPPSTHPCSAPTHRSARRLAFGRAEPSRRRTSWVPTGHRPGDAALNVFAKTSLNGPGCITAPGRFAFCLSLQHKEMPCECKPTRSRRFT